MFERRAVHHAPVRPEVSKDASATAHGLRYLSPALRYLRANGKGVPHLHPVKAPACLKEEPFTTHPFVLRYRRTRARPPTGFGTSARPFDTSGRTGREFRTFIRSKPQHV